MAFVFSLMCASTQRGKTKSRLCYAQRKNLQRGQGQTSTLLIIFCGYSAVIACGKIPHTNSLRQLDTHPSSLSKKTGVCSLTATVLRTARFFGLASPPYVSATFAGCLQALPTKPRATLASKGGGQSPLANRGALYRDIYT